MCPVTAFKLYMSKLSMKVNYLWQKPRRGQLHFTDDDWYEPNRVGHDPLERFMKFFSTEAGLSMLYTNHSIRATVITILDNRGVEARHIMKLSSHKNESTIKEYSRKCPENKKKRMYGYLSEAINPTAKRQKIATATKPTEQKSDVKTEDKQEQQNSDPTFNILNLDWEPLDHFDTINDQDLAKLLEETEQSNLNTNNSNKENTTELTLQTIPQTAPNTDLGSVQNQEIYFNTVNNNRQAMAPLPQMYFPHSSVNIHNHFYQ